MCISVDTPTAVAHAHTHKHLYFISSCPMAQCPVLTPPLQVPCPTMATSGTTTSGTLGLKRTTVPGPGGTMAQMITSGRRAPTHGRRRTAWCRSSRQDARQERPKRIWARRIAECGVVEVHRKKKRNTEAPICEMAKLSLTEAAEVAKLAGKAEGVPFPVCGSATLTHASSSSCARYPSEHKGRGKGQHAG